MADQPKTEYADRLAQLLKMEYALQDENPTKSPARTACEQELAELQEIECKLAYTKLTFLEAQDAMKEEIAHLSQTELEKVHADLTRLIETSTEIGETLNVKKAKGKVAIQKNAKVVLGKVAKMSTLEAEMKTLGEELIRLTTFATYATRKDQRTSSEPFEEGPNTSDDTLQEETDYTSRKEAERKDGIRQKAVFAHIDVQMALIRAQTKSLGSYIEFKALNDAFLRKLDRGKAQRQRAAQEKVDKTS